MTVNAIYDQPSFILKSIKYRETSLIIDVLTQDFGRFSLLARGIRKAKSTTAAWLQPFIPLTLSYTGGGELKILTDVNSLSPPLELKGMALYCGFYVNELVMGLLHQHDSHPEVFIAYQTCLTQLVAARGIKIEAVLRLFELDLIEKIGYGLQLDIDFMTGMPVESAKKYAFNLEYGPYADELGYLSGSTLQALSASALLSKPAALNEAKVLMRMVIDTYLQGRPLKSRQVINQIIKRTSNE